MPSKLDFYAQMADHTAKQVTGSFGEWTAFLETMGRLYKYPFHEQLMIFAQKPNATACADYDLWNKQMGRYVRRGSKGIALIDTTGDNPRLKYVFDVSDTGGRDNSRRLNLWEYKDEHQDAVTASLENRFGVSGEKGLADQLEQIASKLVTEYWNDNRRDILGILADSFLEEYDDYNVEVAFRNAATVSTTYTLMSRCGLNPADYFEHEDFLSVFDFNTRDTIAVLGSAVSNSSEQILRQIAITVKNYEREASLQNQAERTQSYGEQFELHAERGLLDPESDLERDRDEAFGQVRTDEEEIPAGAQTSAVEQHDSVGDPVSPSEGDRRDSESKDGTVDARTDEAERRNGELESQRPDEVGGLDEQPQKPSRRNNSRRTDPSVTGQLSLFDEGLFPTEQEQIAFIDEAESVNPTPFAFSFAQDDIDDVLRLASNTEDTRMVVAAAFQKQKPMEEIAELLKKEYHGGAGIKSDNGEFSVWYAEDGMHLAKGRTARYKTTAQVISWEAAAERIGQLMQDGKYASNVELVEAEGHERMKLSHLLWYLRGDLSDEAREQNILSTLADYRRNGFPDATARLAEDLKDPAFRERLAADYTAFLEAYTEDRRIMRFNYHKPHEIWNRLKDLDLPRREYTSDMAEVSKVGMFITEDEIDATLAGGSNVEGGKGRIYGYLTSAHNAKEKADFLKNEYGISGSSHAVSGRGWRDSNGKGIRLQKPDCADVELNWHKVLAQFENIIRNGRYFTPEEQVKYDEMQTREWQFRKHMDAYNDIKHDHPDDIVLFQVGDFFEMYGEDAKTVSELLDLNLTTRPVAGAGRVDMCGIPAHRLEQFTEKLRETHSVTIARHNSIINEHTKGKTLAQSISDRTDYGLNPEKTNDGELTSAYACDPRSFAAEVLVSKRQYKHFTGKHEKNDVLVYQVRQSFKPGEVTPEEANQIGYDFASRFLKGKHAFFVCTHTDKAHIHNHIYWNAVTLDCKRKFRNFRNSSKAIARLSDLICTEHQLSVITNPQRGSSAYNKWHGFKGKPSHRELLRIAIDEALEQKPHDFDAFLTLLSEQGFKVKKGKHLTFTHADFKQNIRMYTLGDEYSEDAIRAILKGQKVHQPKKRRMVWDANRPQSIIDIQAKLAAGKGEGYRRWATVENLKRMAKTKLYMDEHGFSYEAMAERKTELSAKEKELSVKITEAQNRLAEINVLKTHIVNYSKTRDVYVAYRKSGYSKKFLEEHEADIIIHKAAKKAFDEMGVKKLPTVKSLQVEFADLLTAKKEAYAELKKVRDELRDLTVHKANYEELRDLEEREKRKEKEHGRE